jgi:F-type H+-transporting ATPase subunit epsilon
MQLEILTPDKTIFTGEIDSATFPGSKGQFQVFNNHAALVSSLDKGVIKVKSAQGAKEFEISGGVFEVLNNKIVVLA